MWELDYKESWALKNWCFWGVVLEKTLESPLDSKEIQPVHPEGNQPWIFIGRTDGEVETPILWPLDAKNWLIGKDPDAGKDWRQEKKGTMEDEMVGWHHQLDGHESEQALGVGDGQGSLACCSPWGHKKSNMTEWLNWLAIGLESFHLSLLTLFTWGFCSSICFYISPYKSRFFFWKHYWSKVSFSGFRGFFLLRYIRQSPCLFIDLVVMILLA